VAVVFSITADGEIPETYVTIYNKSNKTSQYDESPNVESWIYPLYYFRNNNNKQISRAAYVKYHIAIRNNFNIFIMGKRLFQQ